MKAALKISNIEKTMGKKKIINNLSFETYEGEVFGFLGPNGAGKTTTIKMIVGMIGIDSGNITVCDEDVEKHFEKAMTNIGAIVENPEMYKYMSGMDNLKLYARIRKGVTQERINEVVELVGLSNRINDKVKKYSLGMRQRLGLAQALLHKPKVIILDEPTNGLDPAGIRALRDILKELAHKESCSIIVSSHLMSEMELMCDRVGILVKGELVGVKTIEEMLTACKGDESPTYKLEVSDTDRAQMIVNEMGIEDIAIENESILEFELSKNNKVQIQEIVKKLVYADIDIYTVSKIEKQSLEEAFIELTEDGGSQIA